MFKKIFLFACICGLFTVALPAFAAAPTDIALSLSSIDENNTTPSTIGTLTTTDPDIGDIFTYTLIAGAGDTDNAIFSVIGDQLTTNTVFNYESKNSYSIRVQSSDGVDIYEEVLTININDLNSAPTDISLSANTINENLPIGTTIGTLIGTDDNENNNTLTYSLVAGAGDTDNSSFQITGDTLKSNIMFNFEVKSSYSIRVRVSDGTLNYEKALTIGINNINLAPTDITLSANTIIENQAAGTVIGTLTGTDDGENTNTLTFSLVTGTGSTDNANFQIIGNILQSSMPLNFEVKNTHSIRIRVSDGSLNYHEVFSVTVTDINDAPSGPTLLWVQAQLADMPTSQRGAAININSHPYFSAIFQDEDAGETTLKMQVQIDDTSDFSSPVTDQIVTLPACNKNTRCLVTALPEKFGLIPRSVEYFYRIRFFDDENTQGAWNSDVVSFYYWDKNLAAVKIVKGNIVKKVGKKTKIEKKKALEYVAPVRQSKMFLKSNKIK